MGINLFNMGSGVSLRELKSLTHDRVTLMGNIPPREVMAGGSPEDVRQAVRAQFASLGDSTRILFSCGGGMPPGVPTENIEAFIGAVRALC